MKLCYYPEPNFGDTLNKLIFPQLLPDFFDNNMEYGFIGIGSIIGFDFVDEVKNKIVFSSGFAYGKKPKIDDKYDIICVRGPLTADFLGLHKQHIITDGAILVKYFNIKSTKKFDFSFMPHWTSELKYDWKSICDILGIKYISPITNDPEQVIYEISATRIMISEALHGVIVADALRVPWIPLKAYTGINNFKWQDWALSMSLEIKFNKIISLFSDNEFVKTVFKEKMSKLQYNASYPLFKNLYLKYQNYKLINKAITQLERITHVEPTLSNDNVLNLKYEQILNKIELVKRKYN